MRLSSELLHRWYKVGVWLKGLDGALELAGGLALQFTTRASLRTLVVWLTRGELQEDPTDFVANHLLHFSRHLSLNTKNFATVYLVAYGITKLGLVAALLKNQRWAYPAALVVLGLFLCAQGFQLVAHRSPGLALVSVVDLVILVLVWCEYRRVRATALSP